MCLLLQQLAEQALGRMLVAPALDEDVEHHPVLVHRPPEPVLLPRDLHGNLVEVPRVSGTGQPATDLVGDALAELEASLPYGFVADRDAARGQDLIHVPQAQRKPEIEPDRMADDRGRKAVAGIAGTGGCRHPTWLRDRTRPTKPPLT